MASPLLFGFLIALAIVVFFVGIWRLVPRTDPVVSRLSGYGQADIADGGAPRQRLPLLTRLTNRTAIGPRLAEELTQADIPLTATEYLLIIVMLSILGFFLGTIRSGAALGLLLGSMLALAPVFYLRFAKGRRRRAIINQLPDVLTLLVGSLRAGYGLNQTIETLVDQLPPPTSKEFTRVSRAVGLGVPVTVALRDMAARVDSDDLDLVVTAIAIQSEMGGNLATVLEKASETVRERLRIFREVRVLTAQQRLSSYIVAGMPFVIFAFISFTSPEFTGRFFENEILRIVGMIGIAFILLGFLLMHKITDIDV